MAAPSKRESGRVARAFDLVTVTLFCALVAAPAVDCMLRTDADRGPGPELRMAAQRPSMPHSLTDIAAFPAAYEAYWKDSFGLRDVFLRWHSVLKVLMFGVSPDPNHIVGRDTWIFNDNNYILDNWRGVMPFRTEELEQWRLRIERRRDVIAELGAHYLLCISPDKPQIYPDYLPSRYNKVGPSRMDQLFEYMKAHSDADVFDLRPTLIAERVRDNPAAGDFVYFQLGTHWSKRGAIAGYNAIAAHLRPHLPTLTVWPMSIYRSVVTPGGDSEARNMYIGDLVPQLQHWWAFPAPRAKQMVNEERPRKVTFEVADPTLPRVLMFHDSFGLAFQDEWSEACSRLTMINSYDFDVGLVEHEQPDLVFEFIVERSLATQVPSEFTEHERDPLQKSFDSATETLVTVDATHPLLRGLFQGTWSIDRDEQGQFVQLQRTGDFDSFAIDQAIDGRSRRLLVKIDIEVARAGRTSLYYKRTNDSDWSADRRVSARVRPGRNTVYLEVPRSDAALDGLVLEPHRGTWTARLRSLVMRALDVGG